MIIRKRGNRYYYHFDWYDSKGKRHQVERAGTESKKETRKMGKAAEAAIKASCVQPSSVTAGALFEEWINAMEKSVQLKSNTLKKYKSTIQIYLTPLIGKVSLRKITPKMLQGILDDLRASASHSTINTVSSVLKRSFEYAVVMGEYLPSSPAASIHVPRELTAPPETIAFTNEEIEKLIEAHASSPLLLPIEIAYYTGMRVGEILALSWDDIGMDARTIRIHATVTGDGEVQDIPKSKSSTRTIPFGTKLESVLLDAHAHQQRNRLEYGRWYHQTNRVCIREDGKPLTPNNIRGLNKWIGAHLHRGSFHTLRHTYATMMLENGADLELVSKHLGHSSINITAKYYSHVLEKRRSKLTSLMDQIL